MKTVKSLFIIIALLIITAMAHSQVTITADSNFIQINRTGSQTAVLFCKDIKFGYINGTFYLADKLSNGGWDYTVKYSDIATYNGVAKADPSFPSFNTLRDALITMIIKGKSTGISSGGSGGTSTLELGPLVDSLRALSPKIVTLFDSLQKGRHQTAYIVKMLIGDSTAGGTQGYLTVHNVARSNGLGGYISKLCLTTDTNTWGGAVIRVHFFDSVPATHADRDYYYITYDLKQAKHWIGSVDVTLANEATGGPQNAVRGFVSGINLPFTCASNSRNIYAKLEVLTVVGTPTRYQRFYLTTTIDQY